MALSESAEDALDPLTVEALRWVTRLTSGEATQADLRALAEWRAEAPAHEEAFREAAAFRRTVRAMKLAPAGASVIPLRPRSPVMSRRAMLAGSGAAATAAAAVAVASPPYGLWPSFAEMFADYRTGRGETEQFSPIAGVEVVLNARSALSLLGSGAGASLIVGEALVTVAGAAASFGLHAGAERFVTGEGSFNIRRSRDEISVVCLAGVVRWLRGREAVELRKGQSLTSRADARPVLGTADPNAIAAWRSGLLVFERTPLDEAVDAINRYYDGKLILADASLAKRPVNGMIHVNQIGNAVIQLQQLLGLRVRYLPGNIVLLG